MFRTLTADEIECRVAQVGKTGQRIWASILIYKDARVDQKLLDEVIGPMDWKNEYSIVDGNLYCTVSIWDREKKEWISKQNVGTESNTEKEKGQASDAFKRACFNWGLGRELYTAPKIFLDLKEGEYREEGGRYRCSAVFSVKEIGYNAERAIDRLVVVDRNGNERFRVPAQQTARQAASQPAPQGIMTKEEFKRRWDSDERGGGITFDDIAECAKAWGLYSKPKTVKIEEVRDAVLQAAGCFVPEPEKKNVYYSSDGKRRLVEGGKTWKEAAARVANGESTQDGTPLSVQIAEYYNVPAEAMSRFFDLVHEIKSNKSLNELMKP